MKKTLLKNLLALSFLMVLCLPILSAQAVLNVGTNDAAVNSALGLGSQDPKVIISKVINFLMGFLGVVAVVIILIAGFKWMTAAGNEENVESAKKILSAGVIGLVIVLASWGIASYVLNNLVTMTNN